MATRKKSKSSAPAKKMDRLESTPNYCSLKEVPPRTFSANVSVARLEMIVISDRKWVNGTKLKYYFFSGNDGSPASWKGDASQKNSVKKAFAEWKSQGIGLEFEEVNNKGDAEVRIGFKQGDGAWSYVGRDVIDIASSPDERTMNFGWNIANDIDTPIHEIGHTLGAPHEHQNPNAGIVWDEEAVYAALAKPPNSWSRDKTFHNIIRKLPVDEIEGSTHDPNSVMHYPFEAGLIKEPAEFRSGINPAGGLSAKDKEFVKKFYPPIAASDIVNLKLSQSAPLNIAPGEQKNFRFKPSSSRKYKIETFGQMDTVMVLFEKTSEEEIYLAGDDDSGTDFNSKIHQRLIKGREYIIRIRLYYSGTEGTGSVMVF